MCLRACTRCLSLLYTLFSLTLYVIHLYIFLYMYVYIRVVISLSYSLFFSSLCTLCFTLSLSVSFSLAATRAHKSETEDGPETKKLPAFCHTHAYTSSRSCDATRDALYIYTVYAAAAALFLCFLLYTVRPAMIKAARPSSYTCVSVCCMHAIYLIYIIYLIYLYIYIYIYERLRAERTARSFSACHYRKRFAARAYVYSIRVLQRRSALCTRGF